MTAKKCRATGCTLLLALGALAVIAAISTPALAQLKLRPRSDAAGTCGGGYNSLVSPTTGIFAGSTVNVTVTMTAAVTGGTTTNTESITEFDFDLDCSNGGNFIVCSEESNDPISWAGHTISTTCLDASSNPVTWSTGHAATATPDLVTMTPSATVVLPSNGSSCTISFDVTVNSLGNDSSPSSMTQAGSWTGTCQIDAGTLGGGAIGADSFDVSSCSVSLDKQVSCDYAYWNDPARGNDPTQVTWHDVTGSDDATGTTTAGCTAFAGDTLAFRYIAKDTGTVALNSCTITDLGSDASTKVVADVSPGTIVVGTPYNSSVITTDNSGNPLSCDSAHSALEPNTATVSCTCAGAPEGFPPVTASDTATFSCETCDATIDKQVACQGTTYDVACNDVTNPSSTGCDPVNGSGTNVGEGNTTQSSSCTALDGHCSNGAAPTNAATCTGGSTTPTPCVCAGGATFVTGENVGVTYVITQRGQDELDNCTATETNGLIVGTTMITSSIGGTNGTITGGGSPPTVAQTINFTPQCSTPLAMGETSGDTAELKCTCKALPGNTAVQTIDKTDTAEFNCLQPGLSVTKDCTETAVAGVDTASITATNNGTTQLVNCNVTDTYLESTGTTPVDCPQTVPFVAGAGQSVQTVPSASFAPAGNSNLTLAASGGTQTWLGTGAITGLTADACNDGSVTCNVGTSTGPTITANFEHTCPVPVANTCESVTPGFFKNHPDSVDEVIIADAGGSIQSCGLNLTNAEPNTNCSVIDDLAIVGGNWQAAGIDPTDAQLVYQCVTAELNLAATIHDGGNCSGNDAIPGSALTFSTCCGLGGVCATGKTDPVTHATVSDCQAAVAGFNTDRTLFNPTILQGKADSSDQRAATDVNALGTTSSECGGSRTYVSKVTGKK